jgi:hypothetical protein
MWWMVLVLVVLLLLIGEFGGDGELTVAELIVLIGGGVNGGGYWC